MHSFFSHDFLFVFSGYKVSYMNQRRLHSDTPPACTVKSGKKLSAAATPPTDALHDAMLVTVPDDLPDSLDKRIDRKTMMSARTYHKEILRSHPMISADLRHPLRHVSDYPGLMCLHRLRSCQALDQLDDNTFFPARFSATSFYARACGARCDS